VCECSIHVCGLLCFCVTVLFCVFVYHCVSTYACLCVCTESFSREYNDYLVSKHMAEAGNSGQQQQYESEKRQEIQAQVSQILDSSVLVTGKRRSMPRVKYSPTKQAERDRNASQKRSRSSANKKKVSGESDSSALVNVVSDVVTGR
jgi:hypothetical protein